MPPQREYIRGYDCQSHVGENPGQRSDEYGYPRYTQSILSREELETLAFPTQSI